MEHPKFTPEEKIALLSEIIESRKSVFPRDYSDEKIDEETLREIVKLASFAPSHKRTKPLRLQVFRGDDKNALGNKLAEIYKAITSPDLFLEKKYIDITAKVGKSDTVITISVNYSGLVPEWEELASVAMSVQNMYLACTAREIGCYWSTPGMIRHLPEFLALDDHQQCIGLFYMGKVVHAPAKS